MLLLCTHTELRRARSREPGGDLPLSIVRGRRNHNLRPYPCCKTIDVDPPGWRECQDQRGAPHLGSRRGYVTWRVGVRRPVVPTTHMRVSSSNRLWTYVFRMFDRQTTNHTTLKKCSHILHRYRD